MLESTWIYWVIAAWDLIWIQTDLKIFSAEEIFPGSFFLHLGPSGDTSAAIHHHILVQD